jgi:hypothetical protein
MRPIHWRTTGSKIAASLAIGVLVALSFGGIADKTAQDYTETGFHRALITYATARAINGIISVAQGTEVAIQPGGGGEARPAGRKDTPRARPARQPPEPRRRRPGLSAAPALWAAH